MAQRTRPIVVPELTKQAYLQRVATAVPTHDVHAAFVEFAHGMLADERSRTLFLRMAARAEIAHRYSSLRVDGATQARDVDAYALYRMDAFPRTAARMKLYAQFAPGLMRAALDKLALTAAERSRIRHVIVTSCTGMYAPGLDFEAVDYLGLSNATERTMIGFMGCYAAMNALKQARHIVRSQPDESVLVLNLELCTLHMQQTQDLNEVLSFLIFGDGCAASLVSSEPSGFALDSFRAFQLEGTRELITWNVGDQGFDMVLSGQVPGRIGDALQHHVADLPCVRDTALWAVHPGGRSVLDAVEQSLGLSKENLAASRAVLHSFGNMSSATVMFVLEAMMRTAQPGQSGCAMAFGPGLTAETMRFHVA